MGLTVEKCIQAWSNSLRQMNAKADIVFLGDSLTYYGDFSSVFSDKVVCNLGLKGDNLLGMINRVEQVKIVNPSVVYLMGGLNDVSNCTIQQFGQLYNRLLTFLIESLPDSLIIVQGMLPVNDVDYMVRCNNEQIIHYNDVIETLCSNNNIRYIDLYNQYVENNLLSKEMTLDGIHLRPCAYNKWYYLLKA